MSRVMFGLGKPVWYTRGCFVLCACVHVCMCTLFDDGSPFMSCLVLCRSSLYAFPLCFVLRAVLFCFPICCITVAFRVQRPCECIYEQERLMLSGGAHGICICVGAKRKRRAFVLGQGGQTGFLPGPMLRVCWPRAIHETGLFVHEYSLGWVVSSVVISAAVYVHCLL